MSVREFAAHLGVSDRMVSKWEAGGEAIRPRPVNQAALDTSFAMASPDIRSRFTRIAIRQSLQTSPAGDDTGSAHLVRHPVDGKLMTLIDGGPFRPNAGRGPLWLPAYYVDVEATTRSEFDEFLAATDLVFPELDPDTEFADAVLANTVVERAARAHLEPVPGTRETGADAPLRPNRTRRAGGARGRSDDQPVIGISREEACAYAAWAGKALPTVHEWDRAQRGREGVVASGIAEWCLGVVGPVRRGRGREKTGFRCSTTVADMLALLAI